ncbi:M1 family aminopeptidase [Dokdonia sp.]|uniref:ABC transporter permease/M1 family aminopeptidase n=1 Tax=Dokdonia sp. TaxID=2024995 RepID=UPI003263F5A8
MFLEIFKFELKYRAKRADTYIYFVALFLFSIIAVDFLNDEPLGALKRNAPIVIARTLGIISALFMMISSMIMGVAILRDFNHGMESLMFINPIKKRDYLAGRFLGSLTVLLLIFCAAPLGMMLGDLMPWHDPIILLPFNGWHYIQPFITIVIPTLFFGGAIFFVSGMLSRKLIVVYTQGILFLMIYLISMQLVKGSDHLFTAALLEPFTFMTIGIIGQYWTIVEKNSFIISLEGVLLYNRLIWMGIGILVLLIGYYRFRLIVVRDRVRKRIQTNTKDQEVFKSEKIIEIPHTVQETGYKAFCKLLVRHSLFYYKSILKEVSFWAIIICAMSIVLISSINLGTAFGVDSYPTSFIIIGELIENTAIFFLLIIIFYSGELIWKERDKKIQPIYDALPISDTLNITSKFIGLMCILCTLIIAMIIGGVLFQTFKGYYQYELDVYFTIFFIGIFPFLFLLSIVSFFFQVLINHKFVSHIVTVIVGFAITIPLKVKGLDHGLYTFGGADLGGYSDMNGYGHFLTPYLWFKVYWIAFVLLLFIVAIIISVRGLEVSFLKRIQQGKLRFTKSLQKASSVLILIFVSSGSYIFYNTNVLNTYTFPSTENTYRANYEKELKQFEHIPQPKIVDVHLTVELYPSERKYSAEGYFLLTNTENDPITEIHIQELPSNDVHYEYLTLNKGTTINKEYEKFGHPIFELDAPLQPGDSIHLNFKQVYAPKGFTEDKEYAIIHNGTFFTNFHFPTIGYQGDIEIEDVETRKKHGLEPQNGRATIDDPLALMSARSEGDGEEINFEMIMGTEADQTAVAPGYLHKEWIENERHYFHYKMNSQMSNFYAMLSARYEVVKDQWVSSGDTKMTPVGLEIYYHKGHEYNLDRMLHGMKKSFDYFNVAFSPYQYQQIRIVEMPNYQKKAQSFPTTIPFSENIGFILDIDDNEDLDMPFFVTAHELAHQWWGHQVNPANVQGKSMISESLAQYGAMMVFKKEFSKNKMQQLLKQERYRYLKGRTLEEGREMPLSLVDRNQDYIHYGKGMVNLYAFQDYISEDSVNVALQRFIKDWNSFDGIKKTQTKHYPTTKNLLRYFREVTPDSLQYTITDLFETVTLYENKTVGASYNMLSNNQYKVQLEVEASKFRLNTDGIENEIPINDWIDIGVYSEETNELLYLKKHKITEHMTTLDIIVDQKPSRAGIDPLSMLIDREDDDNIMLLEEK